MKTANLDLFGFGALMAEVLAAQAGAPRPTGEKGVILNRPVYADPKNPQLIYEHIDAGPFEWACYSKGREDTETMAIGYGQTLSEARDRFLEQYSDGN